MWRTTGWVAKEAGVTRMAVNKWIHQGRYPKIQQTPGGHYRIWVPEKSIRIGYCRVSSSKQQSSLDTQRSIIDRAYPGIEIVADIGSGFNFKRRGFRSLLERCLRGDAVEIVVSTNDRLARSGFQFIRWAVELHGGKVTELETSDGNEAFDTAELVGFITSFIASYHGKRSSKRHRRKESESLS